jgi:hypothetical protein
MSKVPISTHESFSLNRPALAQILSLVINRKMSGDKKKLTSDEIHELTSLGTRQVKAARPYAKSSGLIDDQDIPTRLGEVVFVHDPGLSLPATQWAIHYHLATTPPQTPNFWQHLVNISEA